jgi:hypothetical protein
MTKATPDMEIIFEHSGVMIKSHITNEQTALWNNFRELNRLWDGSEGFESFKESDENRITIKRDNRLLLTACFDKETDHITSFSAKACDGVEVSVEYDREERAWNIKDSQSINNYCEFTSKTNIQITQKPDVRPVPYLTIHGNTATAAPRVG